MIVWILVCCFCAAAALVAGLVWLVTRSKPKTAWSFGLVVLGLFVSFALLVWQKGMAWY